MYIYFQNAKSSITEDTISVMTCESILGAHRSVMWF